MGGDGWRLKLAMVFQTARGLSKKENGGPQGEVHGLFLLLVLVNDVGFQGKTKIA